MTLAEFRKTYPVEASMQECKNMGLYQVKVKQENSIP